MKLFGLILIVGLGVAGAAWLVFVPHRPAPNGPKSVGQAEFVLRDSQERSVPVTVWYPAAKSASNAPLDIQTPAPVVLYSPGWGGKRRDSSAQVENLASHGFVVVACDDSGTDTSFDFISDAAMTASIERAGRDVVGQAGRLVEVLRALTAGQAELLAGRLNLDRVVVLGYSIGGPSGLMAASQDPRIVGVFNLDGGLFGPPSTEIGTAAYFLVSSVEAFPTDAELASPNTAIRNSALVSAIDIPRNRRRMERPNSYWIQIAKANHGDMADSLFAFSRARPLRTSFERRAIHSAIQAHQVAFFRSVLLDDPAPMLALVGRNDQTVRWISSTSPPVKAAKVGQ